MTEVIPQIMPNMVRKLRSFVSQRADIVCLRISKMGMGQLVDGMYESGREKVPACDERRVSAFGTEAMALLWQRDRRGGPRTGSPEGV